VGAVLTFLNHQKPRAFRQLENTDGDIALPRNFLDNQTIGAKCWRLQCPVELVW